MDDDALMYCNFCGKSNDMVVSLIAGPDANICNECTEQCIAVFRKEGVEPFASMTAKILPFRRKDDDHGRRTSPDPSNPRGSPPDSAA